MSLPTEFEQEYDSYNMVCSICEKPYKQFSTGLIFFRRPRVKSKGSSIPIFVRLSVCPHCDYVKTN